jgi:hypothetical protein
VHVSSLTLTLLNKQTSKQANKQTSKQANKQTNRQTLPPSPTTFSQKNDQFWLRKFSHKQI